MTLDTSSVCSQSRRAYEDRDATLQRAWLGGWTCPDQDWTRPLPSGQVVLAQGVTEPERLDIIRRGQALVEGGWTANRPLWPRRHFGEIALLMPAHRTATVAGMGQEPIETWSIGDAPEFAVVLGVIPDWHRVNPVSYRPACACWLAYDASGCGLPSLDHAGNPKHPRTPRRGPLFYDIGRHPGDVADWDGGVACSLGLDLRLSVERRATDAWARNRERFVRGIRRGKSCNCGASGR